MYREVPPYLRDLIHRLTNNYLTLNVHRRPGCYDQLVAALLGDNQHEALFIVLNYDTLLENSLSRFSPGRTFDELDRYVSKSYQANVVKVHGSTNWFWPLAAPLSEVIRELDLDRFDPEALEVNDNVDRVGRDTRYPAVTAPVTGSKRPVCPVGHLDFACDFISRCRKFLIIGTSGYDEDLIRILSGAKDTLVLRVHFVSYAGKDEEGTWNPGAREKVDGAWARFSAGLRNAEVGISYDGFRMYVSSDAFRSFVAA